MSRAAPFVLALALAAAATPPACNITTVTTGFSQANVGAPCVDGAAPTALFKAVVGDFAEYQGGALFADTLCSCVRLLHADATLETISGSCNSAVFSAGESTMDHDGAAAVVRYSSPRAVSLDPTLAVAYGADVHSIRALDLGDLSVQTIAGPGTPSCTAVASATKAPAALVCIDPGYGGPHAVPGAAGETLLFMPDNACHCLVAISVPHADFGASLAWTLAGSGERAAYPPGLLDGTGMAATFLYLNGLASTGSVADGTLVLYVAEQFSVARVTYPAGVVTRLTGDTTTEYPPVSFADGPRGTATLRFQFSGSSLVTDPRYPTSLIVPDSSHFRVRVIDTMTGAISTLLGNGTKSVPGVDGEGAANVTFIKPTAMALRANGGMWVYDESTAVRHFRIMSCPPNVFPMTGSEPLPSQPQSPTPSATITPSPSCTLSQTASQTTSQTSPSGATPSRSPSPTPPTAPVGVVTSVTASPSQPPAPSAGASSVATGAIIGAAIATAAVLCAAGFGWSEYSRTGRSRGRNSVGTAPRHQRKIVEGRPAKVASDGIIIMENAVAVIRPARAAALPHVSEARGGASGAVAEAPFAVEDEDEEPNAGPFFGEVDLWGKIARPRRAAPSPVAEAALTMTTSMAAFLAAPTAAEADAVDAFVFPPVVDAFAAAAMTAPVEAAPLRVADAADEDPDADPIS